MPSSHFAWRTFRGTQGGVVSSRIEGFDYRNALGGAFVNKTPEAYELELAGLFCRRLSVRLEPGIPQDSMYCGLE